MSDDRPDLHGFAAACLAVYKDKEVEINTGESSTTLLMADFETSQKDLIRGVLVDAIGDALIVEFEAKGEKKKIIISCWSVISITEIGCMSQAYYDEDFRRNRRAF
jgi:hypothetical protein